MSDLISVLYISRATFKPLPATQGIEPHVGRILQASRTNNAERNIGGVLFYGDGCFFQCLEGEADQVKALLEVISEDKRHTDIRVVSETSVSQRHFGQWSMKYTSINAPVKSMLKEHGYDQFDPYRFTGKEFKALMATLRQISDNQSGDQVEGEAGPGTEPSERQRPQQLGNRPAPQAAQPDRLARTLSASALIISLMALTIALL